MSSGLLSSLGLLVAAAGACAAMLMPPTRGRSLLMVATLLLLPVLIVGDQWDTPRVEGLRDSPATVMLGIAVGGSAIAAVGFVFARWPLAMPLVLVAAMPFRVPLEAGGDQANLLVPLYLVLAAAVLSTLLPQVRQRVFRSADGLGADGPAEAAARPEAVRSEAPPGGNGSGANWAARLRILVPIAVALYALQSLYSDDLSTALQDVCFFLVPFSLAFVLLREVPWTRRLLLGLLAVVVGEAVLFSLFGFWEYLSRHLIWNPEVIRANEFHIYFRVNSLFWDPNMYGRFLVLVIIALTTLLLWSVQPRRVWALAGLILLLWLALASTFSLSSFAALLAGLAMLAALRWNARWTGLAVGLCLLVVGAMLFLGSDLFKEETTLNKRTSGRGDLVTGGIELFAERPVAGFGSASFSRTFLERVADGRAPVSESHTEPVTVAVEQGVIGLAVYFALIAAALGTMCAGLRRVAPGLGGSAPPRAFDLARIAVLAAFTGLLVHTLSYAGFLEDPITWLLLALAPALAPAAAKPGDPLEH